MKKKNTQIRLWAHMNRSKNGRLRFVMFGGEPSLYRRKKEVLDWIEDYEVKGDVAVRVTVTVESPHA
jgi:sulfatase maturation enzyme AslB (radical SAM superfamily)